MVCSGVEGFLIELGAFNFLGLEALTANEASYLPDFSAKVINRATLLKVKRSHYQRLVGKANQRQQPALQTN